MSLSQQRRREARRQVNIARMRANIARDNERLRVAEAEFSATVARVNDVPPEYSALPEPTRKKSIWKRIKSKLTRKTKPPAYVEESPPAYSGQAATGGSRRRRKHRRSLRKKRTYRK